MTYANEAKIVELNVDPEELASKGAVSAQVAIMMAKGALERAEADYAISVTGIAGPTNEGSKKPVGTVYVGIASIHGWANAIHTQIGGTRAENKAGFVYLRSLLPCSAGMTPWCVYHKKKRMRHWQNSRRNDLRSNGKRSENAATKKPENMHHGKTKRGQKNKSVKRSGSRWNGRKTKKSEHHFLPFKAHTF